MATDEFIIEVDESWLPTVEQEAAKPYFSALAKTVTDARSRLTVYPPPEKVFAALQLAPLHEIRVVIIGQDPYFNPGQANGLAFSVAPGFRPLPPSLVNILKESRSQIADGDLTPWAQQGVLLLNSSLTVCAGRPNSHAGIGWGRFTDSIVSTVSALGRPSGIVFMLWGRKAQEKGRLIDRSRHCVLQTSHPSPLSAHSGFLGCGHFTRCNALLIAGGNGPPITW